MSDKTRRLLITLAVFLGIFYLSDAFVGGPNYDMYVKAIEFLAAVIGAGYYWIGSNEKE